MTLVDFKTNIKLIFLSWDKLNLAKVCFPFPIPLAFRVSDPTAPPLVARLCGGHLATCLGVGTRRHWVPTNPWGGRGVPSGLQVQEAE